MPTEILMPALSPTMRDATLARWLVKEGDSVRAGDPLAEVETGRARMEVEAEQAGILERILVSGGSKGVRIDTPIAVLLRDGERSGETGTAPAPPAKAGAPAAPRPDRSPDWPAGTEVERTTMREAINAALAEEMRRDDTVFVMGEEVGAYGGTYKITQGLLDAFGARRVVDTPITEQGFAGIGIGAAWGGLRPVIEFMTWNFAMQAMDQLINSAAKTLYMSGGRISSPIVFRGPNGASARVGAQHSQDFAAWFAHIPGLRVVQPWSAACAKGLLKSAIRDPNPVIFLENEILYGESSEVPKGDDFTIPFGKAKIWREGGDVTIVSFGIGMSYALEAAKRLTGDGIEAEVVDLRSLRPMDTDTVIASVQKTNRCVTVEEGWPVGAIGSHISSVLMTRAFDHLDAPVITCTGKDVPMPYAANLEKLALPSVDEVIAAVHQVTYR